MAKIRSAIDKSKFICFFRLRLRTDGAASAKQTCLLCRVATDENEVKNANKFAFSFGLHYL